ncbi:MAG TPA: hypothetical protein VKX16_16265 [Chloroflexota bacterium]|nr:hypothetical protein [Chloroflexota bacterium]
MFRLLFVLLFPALLLPTGVSTAAGGLPLTAPEAMVIDGWTGNVLYARNANVERDPASTVKIMTALVVLVRHIPLNRVVTISYYAATYPGSSAGLYAGERITLRNLLYAMLLPSGNDAAIAVAEAVAGSPAGFSRLMNAEARRLHLWHTRYLTPNGFDEWGQVTTAHDLAELARAAMSRPMFARVVRTRNWTATSVEGRIVHTWTNTNQLLWRSGAVDGVKTGTTPGAGACLVASARRGGKWVISVNLGSSGAARFADGMALLDYGFQQESAAPSTR